MFRRLFLLSAVLLCGLLSTVAAEAAWRIDPEFGSHGVLHTSDTIAGRVAICTEPGENGGLAKASYVEAGTAGGELRLRIDSLGELTRLSSGAPAICKDRKGSDGLPAESAVHENGNLEIRIFRRDRGDILVVERINADGQPDPGFGRNGRAEIPLPGSDARTPVVRMAEDGRLAIAGTARVEGRDSIFLAELDASGAAQPSAGDRGAGVNVVDATRGRVRIDAIQPTPTGYLLAGVAGTPSSLYLAKITNRPIVCGDGIREGEEACEPGGTLGCCTSDCRIAPAGEICRAAGGVCDAAETCDGESPACPVDRVHEAGVVCRGLAGPCDLAETCDGENTACPQDEKSLAVCREAGSACDLPELCDGMGNECPADGFAPEGSSCFDSSACTTGETCDGSGICSGGTFREEICNAWVCGRAANFRIKKFPRTARRRQTITTAYGGEELKPQPGLPRRQICTRAELDFPGEETPRSEVGSEAPPGQITPADPGVASTASTRSNSEDTNREREATAPREAGHLMSFPLAPTSPGTMRFRVQDLFGSFEVATAPRRWLSVPTSINGSARPAGLPEGFECFLAARPVSQKRVQSGIPTRLSGGEESWQLDVAGVASVCVAASFGKNPAIIRDDGFACHGIRDPETHPRIEPRRQAKAVNQFGVFRFRGGRLMTLCVPADIELLG